MEDELSYISNNMTDDDAAQWQSEQVHLLFRPEWACFNPKYVIGAF